MTRDANDLATLHEQRERKQHEGKAPVRGTLTIWNDLSGMVAGDDPLIQCVHTTLDLSKPGLIIAYTEDGVAEVFAIRKGWYFNFLPDRSHEGE